MGLPPKKRATYDDLAAVPEHLVAEIIDGELVTSPRPASRHARASLQLGVHVGGPFGSGLGGPGGWMILDEPELHLGADVVVPHLAGWRRERMPKLPDVAAFELAPDWICEVVSPGTEPIDRANKMPIYARAGVAHAWLLNPIGKTVEAYTLVAGLWTLATTLRGEVTARIPPFDAIELDVGVLWAD